MHVCYMMPYTCSADESNAAVALCPPPKSGVSPFMYATEWLTTLFIYNLPADAAARCVTHPHPHCTVTHCNPNPTAL